MTTTDNRPAARTAVDGAWRLNVLGPVELCYDGTPVEVTGPTRALLALLARTPGEEVSTATIIAGMWSTDPPEDGEKEVASNVSRLRKALTAAAPNVDPTSVVVTLPAGYILAIQPSNADTLAFERLLADGRRAISVGQPELALRQLDAAMQLWRGKAYQDYGELAFARAEAERLEEMRLSAVESRVDALLALSAPIAPPHLMSELQQLVAEHWHRERLWGQLMTVLVRLGRRADALAVHRRAQEQLAARLRIQPGAELRAVEEAVINRDPMLYGVPLQATTVPAALSTTVPPLVGREEEVSWLCAAIDLAATRRAQARLVVGSPGIGKSRMIAEVAQRAAERGVIIRYWRADARGLETLSAEPDRVSLVIIEDLDQAQHEDVARVTGFVRSALTRPVVTIVTCRDPVRVGDIATVPKLVLSSLDDSAVAEIVRIYAPSASDKAAASAMANAHGVPARVHRAASEWAFARAGRRIDRAAADAVEPRRMLTSLRAEVVGGALDLAHVRARARVLRPAPRAEGSPYPGLKGYGPRDVETFHGRERLVADVLARVLEGPLFALVGDAGTGKSSLLRAGVLPAITAGVLPDSSRWRQVVVTPSTVTSLAELMAPPRIPVPDPALVTSNPLTTPTALMPLAVSPRDAMGGEPDGSAEAIAGEEVADFVPAHAPKSTATPVTAATEATGTDGSGALIEGTPAAGSPTVRIPGQRQPVAVPADETEPAQTLLVVDQFEELFQLDPHARDAFVEALTDATATGRVVVAMRSDFYRRCAYIPALAQLVSANTMFIPAMTEDELRRAILRPAAAAGLDVEPGLVDRLVAEVEDGNGGLAHLATTLRELWRHRNGTSLTLAGYLAGPGLAESIEAYAESVFGRLGTPQARTAGRALLLRLCLVNEEKALVRTRANLTDVLAQAGAGALPALDVLVDGGLVSVWKDVDAVELAHDCLLMEWPRLREAVEEAAAEEYLGRHLHRTAAAWAEGGRAGTTLYRGARLAAALDWAERHGKRLSTVEKEFLTAGQRAALVVETRRQRRAILLWKWLAATMLIALLATAVAVVSVTMQLRAAANAQRADAARLGVQALAEPDLRLSLLLAVAATRLDAGNAGVVRTALQRTPDLLGTAGDAVTAVALSGAGDVIALGSTDGPIRLIRADTLETVATLDYPGHGPVNGMTFTPDGRRLVSWGGSRSSAGSDAASIVVWDVASRRPTGTAFGQVWPDHGGGLLADRGTLVLVQHGRDPQAPATAVGWNIDARTPSTTYPLPTSTVESLVVANDGTRIALGTGSTIVVLTVATGASRQLAGAVPLAFSPDGGTLLAAATADLQVWDLTSGELRTLPAHRGPVLGAAWASDGASFATVGEDGTAVVWNAETLTPLRSFSAGPLPVSAAQFSADNRTLFTVGAGGTLLAWDLTGSRGIATVLAATTDGDAGLLTLACSVAGRDLTAAEWRTYLPDRPYQDVCPG